MGAIVVSLYIAWEKAGIGEYLYNQFAKSNFIEENYADPKNIDLEFPEQKEILFIFIWNLWKQHMQMKTTAVRLRKIIFRS